MIFNLIWWTCVSMETGSKKQEGHELGRRLCVVEHELLWIILGRYNVYDIMRVLGDYEGCL